MTKLAKQTVLRQLELATSLDDMSWHVIQDITRAKIYDRNVLAWLNSINSENNK